MMATRSRTEYDDALVSVAAEGRKERRKRPRTGVDTRVVHTHLFSVGPVLFFG